LVIEQGIFYEAHTYVNTYIQLQARHFRSLCTFQLSFIYTQFYLYIFKSIVVCKDQHITLIADAAYRHTNGEVGKTSAH